MAAFSKDFLRFFYHEISAEVVGEEVLHKRQTSIDVTALFRKRL
jgi:hypothetical protein